MMLTLLSKAKVSILFHGIPFLPLPLLRSFDQASFIFVLCVYTYMCICKGVNMWRPEVDISSPFEILLLSSLLLSSTSSLLFAMVFY